MSGVTRAISLWLMHCGGVHCGGVCVVCCVACVCVAAALTVDDGSSDDCQRRSEVCHGVELNG